MNPDQVPQRLEWLLGRGLPHRAWDFAREQVESPGDIFLRRPLLYRVLRKDLPQRLPSSFWDERRREQARRLDVTPPPAVFPVGVVAFPVVCPAPETDCFVLATVFFTDTPEDELPDDARIDETARRAMAEALEAARRLTGEQRRFRVALEKPFVEPVKGASCGLAVALATLSRIDERGLGDDITATGEVTRELTIRPVSDMTRKSALRREARPLARLLCPAGSSTEEGLLPVSRLEEARAAAWRADPQATEAALADFKHARAEDPDILQLRLRGLAKVTKESTRTSLPLLEFAVAPSLRVRREQQSEAERELLRQLDDPELTPESRFRLEQELARLERRDWGSLREPTGDVHTLSFAKALHDFRHFTVIGDPGAGKSLLTRLAFLACAGGETGKQARRLLGADAWYRPDEANALESLRTLLPMRLELGRFGEALRVEKDLPLEAFLRRRLRSEKAPAALRDGLDGLLREGRLFLLCDGLDEVSKELRQSAVEAVSAFLREYPRVRLLVTTRPHGHDPEVPDLPLTWLAPLGYSQQRLLITRLHRLVETRRRPGPKGLEAARSRSNALLQAIERRGEWQELISNPLLLILSSLVDTHAEGVPKHQVIVFEAFIQTLLQEWRSTLDRADPEDRLLDAWQSAAFELVQADQRHGAKEGAFLKWLDDGLGDNAPIRAEGALKLALETGLVQENGETIKFWHSTFAEFLAARHLARHRGETERFLHGRMTPTTLKFAMALLDHKFGSRVECEAIARKMLAWDEEGARQVLRPGLRAVSDWHANGVRFEVRIRERIWKDWLEVLEQTPPSPLWENFRGFADRISAESLDSRIVARLAQVDAHRSLSLREAIARLVAPAAAREPAARRACEQWLKDPELSSLRVWGALGLASAGEWRDEVIQELSRFGTKDKLPPRAVHTLVKRAGTPVLERLRGLVRQLTPLPRPAPALEEPKALRLAAACLLAMGNAWDDDVARVMKQGLSESSGTHPEEALHTVLRFSATEPAVREALLEWLGDGSALDHRTQKLLLEVAPLFEDMPEKLMERTVGAAGGTRDRLEGLLFSLSDELYTLPEQLGRWLEEDRPNEWRMCAARLLLRLAPQDRRLRETLQQGLRSRDDVERVHWAHLALRLEHGPQADALEALTACARSPDPQVRAAVYGDKPFHLFSALGPERMGNFLPIASDPGVTAQARLDAVFAVQYVEQFKEHVTSRLRELLHADDVAVRYLAAKHLAWRDERTPEVARLLAEWAVWGEKAFDLRPEMRWMESSQAARVVRTVLRELSRKFLTREPQDPRQEITQWSFFLDPLVKADPACVDELLRTLEQPGVVGRIAQQLLEYLLKEHASARDALRQALGTALEGGDLLQRFRLTVLGLEQEATRPEAIALSHTLSPSVLTQGRSEYLASKLHRAGEERAAVQWWRHALEGTELSRVLDAAEQLVGHFPDEGPAWIQEGIRRALESPEPLHRLAAGRAALLFGIHEKQGVAVLVDCLTQRQETGLRWARSWFRHTSLRRYWDRHEEQKPGLDSELSQHSRIDFEAMFELCAHRPDEGWVHLSAWLDDEEIHRFAAAVKILAGKEDDRDRVREKLEHRLRTGPLGTIQGVVDLIDDHGFYSRRMVEGLLGRLDDSHPEDRHLNRTLGHWLHTYPETWAIIREQPFARQEQLLHWIHTQQPIQRELIHFAVEYVLVHAAMQLQTDEVPLFLRRLSGRPAGEAGQPEQGQNTGSPEQVRGWMRECLREKKDLADLLMIVAFDSLAMMAELPASECIPRLRQALALEAAPSRDDGIHEWYLQGHAALRLAQLGERDERIPRLLLATVGRLAESNDRDALRFMNTLKNLRAPDATLRDTLEGLVLRASWLYLQSSHLELFEWVGLSKEEQIELLATRLKGRARAHEVSELLDVLASLGCAPARREALILDSVAADREEPFDIRMLMLLAARPELSAASEARLILTALARARRWETKEPLNRWRQRFTSEFDPDDERLWLAFDGGYLESHQQALVKLMKVDDPALLERVLAGFVTPHPEEWLVLYRAARTSGETLSNECWRKLRAQLSSQPQEALTMRFAKEWLLLDLWQALEPAALRSAR